MLGKLIESLFPQGQRKVMVSLIAILLGAGIDKFGGGLSDHMTQLLIIVVGVFTGGNVLKGFSDALAALKGTSLGQKIEDLVPGNQGLGKEPAAAVANQSQQQLATASSAPTGASSAQQGPSINDILGFLEEQDAQMRGLTEKLEIQAKNVGQLVNIINAMRQVPAGVRPSANPQQ